MSILDKFCFGKNLLSLSIFIDFLELEIRMYLVKALPMYSTSWFTDVLYVLVDVATSSDNDMMETVQLTPNIILVGIIKMMCRCSEGPYDVH